MPTSRLRVTGLAVLGGLAVAASVPPWGFWPLAFVGVAVLDRLLADRPAPSRFRRTTLWAAAWLYPSIVWMQDLTLPGYVVACGAYSVYFGSVAIVLPAGRWRRLGLPGALALAELARWTVPFGGVPLSTIPMGQAGGPLAPAVRIGGGLVLVLLVGAIGVALSALADLDLRPVAALAAVVAATAIATSVAPRGHAVGDLDVAIVQGGGPQNTRAADTDDRAVLERHLAASELVDTPVDLVLWPENVVNVEGRLEDGPELGELTDLARRLDTVLLPGIVEGINRDDFLNATIVITPDGRVVDRYDKVQRVPFGEYVPLRSMVGPLSGGAVDRFIPREAVAGTGPAVVDTPIGRLGVVISWEVFFSHRARDAISNGGEVLLNPTNGASYWLRIVQSQQIASSRLRALETGRWVLQAAPTGFSAVVDPDGRVLDRTAISETRVLNATIERRTGLTWATRVGDLPAAGAASVVLVTSAWLGRRRPASVPDREMVRPRAAA